MARSPWILCSLFCFAAVMAAARVPAQDEPQAKTLGGGEPQATAIQTPKSVSEPDELREEMSTRLGDLEAAKLRLDQKRSEAEVLARDLQQAERAGNDNAIAALQMRIDGSLKSVALVEEEVVAAQALFDRAAERYRVAADLESLDTVKQTDPGATGTGDRTSVVAALQQRQALEVAYREVERARQRVEALSNELEILEESRNRTRNALDDVNTEIDSGREIPPERTRTLLVERQNLLDEERTIEARIEDIRQRLLQAEAAVRIEEDEARELETRIRDWRRRLLRSIGLLVLAVAVLSLARILVSRRVEDPDRRYYLNRNLAYLTFFVVLVGLPFIFVRQF